MKISEKIVLVTGASSGIGLATSEFLHKKGYTVYAAARSFKTEEKLIHPISNSAMYKMYLDITKDDSVEFLIKEIIKRENKIDILINCAAILIAGAVEETEIADFQKVVDTNLYGMIRTCRQVIPYMRSQKKGLIINFSSGAGISGLPFLATYCVSKFAVEGFSEVLRWELKSSGIDVVIMEPGDTRSGSDSYRMSSEKALSEDSLHLSNFKAAREKMASDEANGEYPENVARVVLKIIQSKRPKVRYNSFRKTEKLLPFKMLVPSRLNESMILDYYKMQ